LSWFSRRNWTDPSRSIRQK